ncbi:MAG: hypothetical protein HY293_15460 [Planctomycetes bacterium]|nr:hypothetical protein [Planctomycetota bacterium]
MEQTELPIPRSLFRRPRRLAPKAPLPALGEGLFPLFDPLTVKELRGISRTWRSYFGRAIQVGLIAIVLLRWWSDLMSRPLRFSSSEFAYFARSLFHTFAWGQLALVALAAVSAGSDMIIKEVRSGTLGLLDMASLSPGRIAASKWKSVMISSITLLLCGVPVLAMCVYLGGVGPWEIFWSFTVTGSVAALGAALSVRFSAICHSPLTAILKSAGALSAFSLLLLPFAAPAAQGPLHEGKFIGWMISLTGFWSLAFLALRSAADAVHKRVVTPPPAPRPMNDPELFEENYRRLTLRGPRTLVVHRRLWNRHELLWKEWITRPATRLPRNVRVVVGFLLAFLLWILWGFSDRGFWDGPFCVVGSLLLGLAAINGAVLFGSEKESMKLDLLVATPLTTGQIVRTKLIAGLAAPESVAGLVLAMAAAVGWYGGMGAGGAVAAALACLLFLLFAYALGAAASLYSQTVRNAVLLSCGVLGAMVVGLPWVADMLASPVGGGVPLARRCLEAFSLFSFLDQLRPTREQQILGVQLSLGSALGLGLPFYAATSGLILSILGAIVFRFRRLSGRNRG